MTDSYTKLFASIVTSTIWQEPDHVRLVWITMLAMADMHGVVSASVPGLAHMAKVSMEGTEAALERLSAPDPYSRTPDHEGRRIRAVEGGWLVLNRRKYRDRASRDEKRERDAERMREKRRTEKKSQPSRECREGSPTVARGRSAPRQVAKVAQTETEIELTSSLRSDVRARARGRKPPPDNGPDLTPFELVTRAYARWREEAGLGCWRVGTATYSAAEGATEMLEAQAARDGRPLADVVRDSLAGFGCDEWAREHGYPWGAWAKDPTRYLAQAPSSGNGKAEDPRVVEVRELLARLNAAHCRGDDETVRVCTDRLNEISAEARKAAAS